MQISRMFVVSLLALSLGGLLTACQRGGEPEVTRTEDGVVRLGSVVVVDTVSRAVAPTGRPLVFEGLRGSVHLTGEDGTTANLSFVRRGRGDSRDEGQSVLEGISITESGTEAEYTYSIAAEEENRATVDIRGQVPLQSSLRIDRLSGPVHIDSVEGPLTIEHQHGDVRVRGAAAPVETAIRNGDVQVSFQAVPPDGSILLRTSNGDLQLGLPAGASAQIEARTEVGTIRTQGLSFMDEQFAPVNAGARYEAQLGEGGATIEMRTQNGSISIREIARTRSGPADTTSVPATVPSSDTTMAPQPDADTVDTMGTDTMSVDTTAADSVF